VVPKFNGSDQLVAYVDDWNLLGDNIDNVNETSVTSTDASKEVGLAVK
jgi:hypothetical protein